jgi:D-ornithine 4,5-aminomutase subunit beta
MAPVTAHYGYNNVAQYDESAVDNPASLIGGCTLEEPDKIIYIDELDDDNVYERMKDLTQYHDGSKLRPEMEWMADGTVMLNMCIPTDLRSAEAAALEFARLMNLEDATVIHREVLHGAEGTRIELKGKLNADIDTASLVIPPEPEILSDDEIRQAVEKDPIIVVCGTVGEDEHSVGLREVIDIKHGGIEKYGMKVHYLGTSVPVEKLVDAAIELNANAILASTIISHDDIHYKNIASIDNLAKEKGVRDKLAIVAGGTQVTSDAAVANGADAGFGRGTKGVHVATFLVKHLTSLK